MDYRLNVSPMAQRQLVELPPPLAHFVTQQLERLRRSPVTLSHPAPILQPKGQLFEIHYDVGGASVWVSITFRYGQDEQSLHVEYIATEFG